MVPVKGPLAAERVRPVSPARFEDARDHSAGLGVDCDLSGSHVPAEIRRANRLKLKSELKARREHQGQGMA